MRRCSYLTGTVLVLSLAACSQAERSERILGTISYYQEPIQITLPTSVERGETFTVSVVTYGGGCLEQGDTDVKVRGLKATVTPYDLDTSTPDYPCTDDLIPYTHTAELRFDEAGEARVLVSGLREGAETSQGIAVVETRTLEVR